MLFPVEHINEIDGFAAARRSPYGFERRRDPRFGKNGNIFGSGGGAGAFFGEGCQMEHVFPDALFQRGQNVPPGLSIEQTVEVGAFVGGEMLQQTGGLLFVHVVEKTGLKFFGKIAEQGGGRFSIQPSQQGKDGGAGKGGEFFRQVGGMPGFRHGGGRVFGRGL